MLYPISLFHISLYNALTILVQYHASIYFYQNPYTKTVLTSLFLLLVNNTYNLYITIILYFFIFIYYKLVYIQIISNNINKYLFNIIN